MRTPNQVVLLVGITIVLAACRGDGSEEIIRGYEVSFTSSDGVFITYAGTERAKTIVIDARVDGFKVVGNRILVARRPMEVYAENLPAGNAPGYRTLSTCEHWVIDTSTHEVKQTQETGGLLCK